MYKLPEKKRVTKVVVEPLTPKEWRHFFGLLLLGTSTILIILHAAGIFMPEINLLPNSLFSAQAADQPKTEPLNQILP